VPTAASRTAAPRCTCNGSAVSVIFTRYSGHHC
jgi:hypothetical protein